VKIIRKITSSEFLRNTTTLISGTAIAQVLLLIFAPLISRLFNADDFSVYGVFVAMYSVLGAVITLRYDMAVMLPTEERKARNVVALCMMNALILTIVFFVIALLFRDQIALLFDFESTSWILLLVPPAALFLALNTILMTWYNRNKQYKVIAANRILRNGLLTGSNVGFGFASFGSVGLILSQILSDGLAACYYLYTYFKNSIGFRVKRAEINSVAREYSDFPKFTLPATFIDVFSAQLPILLIASLYSKSLSGSYFFAWRILAIPIAIIGSAYAQTFYQKFVSYVQKQDFHFARLFLRKSWLLLGILITIPAVVLFFWGEPLFVFIFGNEWSESGKISSILILYVMFAFVSSPTSSTFIALGMQKYNLVFSSVVLLYRFAAIYTGYILNDFYLGLILLVIFEVIEIIVYNLVALVKLKMLIEKQKNQ